MEIKDAIRSQYLAALEMLKQSVERCPQELWNAPGDKTKFWQIAYHALFYTHLYLQETEHDFRAWEKHKENSSSLDPQRELGEAYSRAEILEYLAVCQQQVNEKTAGVNLEAGSGFPWLPFNKLELQFYNIRHIQQHTGELMERLGSRAGVDVDWVGMIRD